MNDLVILIIAILILVGYAYYKDYIQTIPNAPSSGTQPTIPPGTTGSAGLDYIRENYASGLAQAKSLCTSQFKGTWTDNSNTIGCYNMQGFNTVYCSTDTIQNLVILCNSIGGNSVCSSTQASCSV